MKPSTLLLPNKIKHLTASRSFSQGPFFAPWVDETVSAALNVRELIRPLGQRLLFSAGNVATLSAFALALTLIRDQTVVGPHLQDRYHLSVSTYTLVNLPYVAQRRIEIARALAAEPSLLLLDEPAVGMKPRETEVMTRLFRAIRKERGITPVLIEHDMRVVITFSERISVMDYGEKISE